jgi:hypothetical protein
MYEAMIKNSRNTYREKILGWKIFISFEPAFELEVNPAGIFRYNE